MIKANKDKFILIICIMLAGFFGFKKSPIANSKNEELNTLHIVNSSEGSETNAVSDIYVHIDGEVNKPGLYKVKNSSRINDVLTMAGGTTALADLKDINLAKKVEDEMKIYIPSTQEMVIDHVSSDNKESSSSKVNINTADKDTLKTLPGIGDTRAEEIIRYREENKFSKPEDLQNISGIGSKTYEKLKDLISVY
ncbi:helix-hairpin-helix domain-containing protein [Lagierella sp.]|uniref:helix-hairpin-helix domain-containing protein n=1 Tax=Lagierella sp. TaxID=2849657 RepID=UPI002616FEEA|nr:helix-hairpin-helix domain-containing protein [Lagierella sp.]